VKSVKLVCDNEAVIKARKRKCTQSMFHRTEGYHDLISTKDTEEVHYEWAKGHADDLNRYAIKLERMNIVAVELCGVIRETARGPLRARPNLGIRPSKSCALFIRGVKVMSNWENILNQQLLDGDLQE
jgi:hypothetical protein